MTNLYMASYVKRAYVACPDYFLVFDSASADPRVDADPRSSPSKIAAVTGTCEKTWIEAVVDCAYVSGCGYARPDWLPAGRTKTESRSGDEKSLSFFAQ